MKIIPIFEQNLYSFRFPDEIEDELTRNLRIWRDIDYLYEFYHNNKRDIQQPITLSFFIEQIIEQANELDNNLLRLYKSEIRFDHFFRPLHNQEYKIIRLSKQKGRQKYLRIYAIKIDDNCFVITGGAIKLHRIMNDRAHTFNELIKLDKCRDFLHANQVFDTGSYFEFINDDL